MSDWPLPGTYESYKKHVLERQVAAQEEAAKHAREAPQVERATRDVMVATIESQTAELRVALAHSADRIADGLADQTERIERALAYQGDRICGLLDEIRWEAAQTGRTLDRLVQVALSSRTNEANQFVKQGVRHFLNEEYSEAEGRFLKALDCDSTDYQVLMNLGFIAVHKAQPDAACAYFRKALTLPDSLDDQAKARALWALARVHYSQHRFAEAHAAAGQANALSHPAKGAEVLTVGVYAAPLGKIDVAIQCCREAITLDPPLFSTVAAYSELDLLPIRDTVQALLITMTHDVLARARTDCENIKRIISARATRGSQASHYMDLLESGRTQAEQLQKRLLHASYEDCLRISEAATKLQTVFDEVSTLDRAHSDLGRALNRTSKELATARSVREEAAELSIAKEPAEPHVGCLLALVLYLLPWLTGFAFSGWWLHAGGSVLVWPLLTIVGIFMVPPEMQEPYLRMLLGQIVGGVAAAALWYRLVAVPRQRLAALKDDNSRRQKENARVRAHVAETEERARNSRKESDAKQTEVDACHAKIRAALSLELLPDDRRSGG